MHVYVISTLTVVFNGPKGKTHMLPASTNPQRVPDWVVDTEAFKTGIKHKIIRRLADEGPIETTAPKLETGFETTPLPPNYEKQQADLEQQGEEKPKAKGKAKGSK